MQAPDFTLPDQNNTFHSLTDYRGRWLVLYFYPKDDTPGCAKEACSFRDGYQDILAANAIVIGISKDTVSSHKRFANKYALPFCLLSDPSGEVIKAYNAWGVKKFMGREFQGILRNTYIIDPAGAIVKRYEKVTPLSHGRQVVEDLRNVQESHAG